MLTREQLQAISFGAVDAESDELLLGSFVETEAFDAIDKGAPWLVLGNKGTGKSAIYKYLASRGTHDSFVRPLSFRHYPWNVHRTLTASGTYAYASSWDFFNIVQLMRFCIDDHSIENTNSELRNVVEIFFRTNWMSPSPDHTLIPSKTLINLTPGAAGYKLFSLNKNEISLQDLVDVFPYCCDNLLEQLINSLNPDNRYWVIFDELDHGFDARSEDYNDMLIGLLQSVRKLNEISKDKKSTCKFVVLLRSDIFDALSFGDKNKIRQSNSIKLAWNDRDEAQDRSSLKRLLCLRMKTSLIRTWPDVERIPLDSIWKEVFDPKEMLGRRTKYRFISDYTRLRPRDAIQLCNLAVEAARKRSSEPFIIRNDDVNSVRKQYSQYFRGEVDDETQSHTFPYKEALALLQAHLVMSFTEEELSNTLNKQPQLILQLKFFNVREILSRLWQIGILAYQNPGRGYEFVFQSDTAQFSQIAERYRVHYGLKENLGLVQEKKSKTKKLAHLISQNREIQG